MIRVEFEPHEVYTGYDKTLADLIIDGCVSRILEDFKREEAGREIGRRLQSIRDEIIADSLRDVVRGALEAALQPTDSFGNPKGEPKTLTEIIRDEAVRILTKPADSYSSSSRQSLIQKMLQEAVSRAVEKELKDALDEGRVQIRGALKAKGAEMLEKALVDMAQNGKVRA